MAKKSYIGVSSKAHTIKRVYIGVNGIAKKVKKIYIGVSNVARQIFTSGELKYVKMLYVSDYLYYQGAATTAGNFAFFAGGSEQINNMQYPKGNCIGVNKALTYSLLTYLNNARSYLLGATVGNKALFFCGFRASASSPAYDIDVYDGTSGAHSSFNNSFAVGYHGVASNGNYALIGGGTTNGQDAKVVATVRAYNSSLTASNVTNLRVARRNLAGASVGGYFLFAGGRYSYSSMVTRTNVVDVYNSALTQMNIVYLSDNRNSMGATNFYNHAVFAGGEGTISKVEIINSSLTVSTISSMSNTRNQPTMTALDEFLMIASTRDTTSIATAEVYNKNFTKLSDINITATAGRPASATIGESALFNVNSGMAVVQIA